MEQVIRLEFSTSNNETEYEAILSGLNLTLALSASKLEICNDSQLVVRHIQGKYGAKDEHMSQSLTKVQDTLNQLNEWAIKRIPRTENVQVNVLAGVAATLLMKEAILLPIHLQPTFSIADTPVYNAKKESTKWTHEIGNYLRTGYLPEDSKHAHRVQVQAARFTLIGDCLYRRSFGGPHLRCLDSMEAQYVLAELHEGMCCNHAGG